MKAKLQKMISLPEIIETLETKPLFDARSELHKSFNAALFLSGTVLKVVKRSGFKLYLQLSTAPSARKMEAFCEFDETELEKAEKMKIKKGSIVSLIGRFQTCGEAAMVVYGCRFKVEPGSALARHTGEK
jgi:hypothetical protein